MERVGDILKRNGTKSREGTGTWSNGESTEGVEPECPLCKGADFVHPLLPSGRPDFSRVILCQCNKGKSEEERLLRVRQDSGDLGLELLRSMTFENFERRPNLPFKQQRNLEDALKLAKNFAERPDGWVVFLGPNGCGKTHLAAAIGNYQLNKGKPVIFVFVPDFLDHLRATFRPDSDVTSDELFEGVKNTPLLILDDFGEQASTPWAQEKLYQIISHRYNARLPMVVTASLLLEDMEQRIFSRMLDPRIGVVFEIDVTDYRADHSPSEMEKRKASRRRGDARW